MQRENLLQSQKYLSQIIHDKLNKLKTSVENKLSLLDKLSPSSILKRGYSFVCDENQKKLSFENISIGQNVNIKFHNGTVGAKIISKSE